jgi:hypothetical protein
MTAVTRPRRMARMVLREALRKLLGRLPRTVVCGLAVTMSACVLPIAPEFQDPPASENYAPVFLNTDPPAGSIVSATPTTVPMFNLLIQDPNINDDLEVRWIVDYPPLGAASSVMETIPVPHTATGLPTDVRPFQPDCVLHHIGPGKTHQLYVVVADRKFEPPQLPGVPIDLERLPKDAKSNSRSWILNLDCSVPQ